MRAIIVLCCLIISLSAAKAETDTALSDLNIKIDGDCFSSTESSGSPPEGSKIVTLENKNTSKRISARISIKRNSFYYINNNGNYRTYPSSSEKYISLEEGGSEAIGCTKNWVSQKTAKTPSFSDPTFMTKSANYIAPEDFGSFWRGQKALDHVIEQAVESVAFLLDYSTDCPSGQSGRNVRLVNLHPNRIIHVEVRINHKEDFVADLYPNNATKLIGCEITEGGPQNFRVKAAKFLSDPLLQ